MKNKKVFTKRKNLWLRTLIDSKGVLMIIAGLIGIGFLPIIIYPLLSEHEHLTFFIFIIQLVWIITIFSLIIYFLKAERYRKNAIKFQK